MKDWFIKKLIMLLEKYEVGKLPAPKSDLEYKYISTQTPDPFAIEYGEWFDYSKKSPYNLQESKVKEGWYIAYIWHTSTRQYWHTNWILARSKQELGI